MNSFLTQGFLNRHLDPLPDHSIEMEIVYNDVEGDHIMKCRWKPSEIENPNHLGTAIVIQEEFNGIGFHAWVDSNAEFVYYRI